MEGFFQLSILLITIASSINCGKFVHNHHERSLDIGPAVSKMVSEYYTTKGSYFHTVEAIDKGVSVNTLLYYDIITGVLRSTSLPTEIEDVNDIENSRDRKRFSAIIFIDSTKSFRKCFGKISYKNFKFRRQFTVVSTSNIGIDEVQEIFSLFWNVSIKSVNLVRQSDNGTIELLTFFPFNEKSCGDTKPVVINTFDINQMKWKNNIFHPIKTKNLYNCTLLIGASVGTTQPNFMATFDSNGTATFSGVEFDIFVQLSKELNFNPRFEVYGNFVGLLYDNGTATGNQQCEVSN